MKILIVGDLHINERSIQEIEEIFDKDILPIEADKFIQVGDWFDKNLPSPAELKFSSELVLKIKQHYKEITILSGTGEHDILRNTSAIEHLASLGVNTIKGDLIYNNLLFGHWMLNESKLAFGTGKCGKKDVAQYKYVFLGHQHSPEYIPENIFHVGSIRYVSFNEVNDKKRVILLEDDKISPYLTLNHCIPMLDVTDMSQLAQIDARTKVRVIFNSFEDYKKNASYVNKIGKKFFLFKIKMNFESNKLDISSKKLDTTISKSSIIKDYIAKIGDVEVRKLLEDQFKETI